MKDNSASVLVTVSVGRSKTLIGAAISPHCMSAACQMKMEGIHAFVCACSRGTHKHFFNHLLYWTHLLVSFHFTSYPTCNYFLQRTHRKVLFTSCAFKSYAALYICVVAAFIFVPYWPHPHLIDISFSPVSFSLADRMQLSDVPLNSSQTLHLSFVCCLRACSNLEMGWICPPSTDDWRSFCSSLRLSHKHA